MCIVPAPANASPAAVAVYELTVAESRLGRQAVERRRAAVLDAPVARIATDLRYVFKREAERVDDLMRHSVTLPYAATREAAVPDPATLARLLLNGVDVNQYQAVLEDLYRTVGPRAMDQVLLSALDAAGIRHRRNPAGDVLLSGGFKLIRSPGAERWIRDNAIVWGRRYAESISARTNQAIRTQLAEGMSKFEPIDALAARVRSVYADAVSSRALMIARTEGARAYGAAQVETGKRLRASGKSWVLSGSDYSYVDVCADNAAMGVIPVDALWAHGETSEPAHPNCECNTTLEFDEDWTIPDEFLGRA